MAQENGLTRTRAHQIMVAVPDDGRIRCGRCQDLVLTSEVALYTRTKPGAPFEPWCVDCAYTLVRWAGMGAVAAAGEMIGVEERDMVEDIRASLFKLIDAGL